MKAKHILVLFFVIALVFGGNFNVRANGGNNGTVKVHDGLLGHIDPPFVNNEAHVSCTLHLHGYFFDPGQTGSWRISTKPPFGAGDLVATGQYPAADGNGEWVSEAITLSEGHYEWDADGIAPHEKGKTFWTEGCQPTQTPTPTPTDTPTPTATYTDTPTPTPTDTPTPTPTFTFTPTVTQPVVVCEEGKCNVYLPLIAHGQRPVVCPESCVHLSINGIPYRTDSTSVEGWTYGIRILGLNETLAVKVDVPAGYAVRRLTLYRNGAPYHNYRLDQNGEISFVSALNPDEANKVLGAYYDYTLQLELQMGDIICIWKLQIFVDPPDEVLQSAIKNSDITHDEVDKRKSAQRLYRISINEASSGSK